MIKYKRVKAGGSQRVWDNGRIAVFFSRAFDGSEGYDYGNYNRVAKGWNQMGARFATLAKAKERAHELAIKLAL